MDKVKDFLFAEILVLEEFDFTLAPINLILIGLCVLFYFVSRSLLKKSLYKLREKSDKLAQKQDTIYRLGKQLFFILSIGLGVESLGVNNDHIHFGSLLQLKLTGEYNGFQLSVYHILLAIIAFFTTRVLLNLFKLYLHRTFEKRDWVDEGKEYTVFQLVKYATYTILIISLVRSTGVKMDLLIASATALFLAVGLGLQGIFADYVSGIILLFEGTVKVGDVIRLDSINSVARVEVINIRTSKVKSREGESIIIPNSLLTSDAVVNWTHQDKLTRCGITVSVAYGSDTRQVESILIESTKVYKDLSKRRPPVVFLKDFGDSGLLFELHFWAEKSFQAEKAQSDIRFEIDDQFRKHGIEIPFPQRVIHKV